MSSYCLIADQIVQIADGRLCRLLFDFLVPADSVSDPERVVCTLGCAEDTHVHGVHSLSCPHPIAHTFTFDLDAGSILLADPDYRHLSVYSAYDERFTTPSLVGIYSRFIFDRTVFVHGALINLPGFGGIMFIGPSGVGKTTQARLWAEHRGAEIINGDKVFLGLREDAPGQVLAYGSPWKGSSPYCVNKRVPLKAIVSLVRSPTPRIRPLNELEIMSTYFPRVYMPSWDDRLTEMVMDTMGQMIPLVPMYEMSCHPDATAVEMVEKLVLGQN